MKEKKIPEQDAIQANNLLEEAKTIASHCIRCGLCKANSSISRATRDERLSPRGIMIMLQENHFPDSCFEQTLDKESDASCPLNIPITDAIQKLREAAVLLKKSPKKSDDLAKKVLKD